MWKCIGGFWINDRIDKYNKTDWYISGNIKCPICKNDLALSAFKNKSKIGKQPDMKVYCNMDNAEKV